MRKKLLVTTAFAAAMAMPVMADDAVQPVGNNTQNNTKAIVEMLQTALIDANAAGFEVGEINISTTKPEGIPDLNYAEGSGEKFDAKQYIQLTNIPHPDSLWNMTFTPDDSNLKFDADDVIAGSVPIVSLITGNRDITDETLRQFLKNNVGIENGVLVTPGTMTINGNYGQMLQNLMKDNPEVINGVLGNITGMIKDNLGGISPEQLKGYTDQGAYVVIGAIYEKYPDKYPQASREGLEKDLSELVYNLINNINTGNTAIYKEQFSALLTHPDMQNNFNVKAGEINMDGGNIVFADNVNITTSGVNISGGAVTVNGNTSISIADVDIKKAILSGAEGEEQKLSYKKSEVMVSGENTVLTVNKDAALKIAGSDLNVSGAGVVNNGTLAANLVLNNKAVYTSNNAKLDGSLTINDKDSVANFNGAEIVLDKEINNAGLINIAANSKLSIETAVNGNGEMNFGKDTEVDVKNGATVANKVSSEGTIVNVALNKGDKQVELNEIFINEANANSLANFDIKTQNALYKLIRQGEESSLWLVEQASASEVADNLGIAGSTAAALLAATSGTSDNASFNAVSDALYEAAQSGDKAVVREAEKLGADAAPVVRVVETSRSNMLFAAVNDELNGKGGAMVESQAEEPLFRKVKAWVRGLFNYADHDGTSKAQGFDADTYGVAMGIDKELDNHVKAGFGYAYSQTDVNGDARDTDVDTNTLFVYGQYKPADWYLNSSLAYSWSDYDEKKSVLGYNANAKYDVDTIALEGIYGLERKLGVYDLNPEFGFRYMHISQDGYTDNLGSKVKSKDSDVLTAVAGAKIAKAYALDNGTVLRPELKAAVTYDVVSDNNNANVILANGAGYRVNGEKLHRFGVELGAKAAAEISDNWELAAGYELRLRKDFTDNTLMLNAKYQF